MGGLFPQLPPFFLTSFFSHSLTLFPSGWMLQVEAEECWVSACFSSVTHVGAEDEGQAGQVSGFVRAKVRGQLVVRQLWAAPDTAGP